MCVDLFETCCMPANRWYIDEYDPIEPLINVLHLSLTTPVQHDDGVGGMLTRMASTVSDMYTFV
jgi:hypothetical protein